MKQAPTSWVMWFSVLSAWFCYLSAYIVPEGSFAMLTQLGELVYNGSSPRVAEPGLHFKIPLIQKVYYFDKRLQTLNIQSSRIVTANKQDVLVDYFVKWKIENPSLYYTRTNGDGERAAVLLQQQVSDRLRSAFGQRKITEVLDDRANIMQILKEQTDQKASNQLGIRVLDVRIKRIDFPTEVSETIYAQMRSEREKAATQSRAQGRRDAEIIRAQADAYAAVTLAQAQLKAAKLRAEGDRIAASIYNRSYSQDPVFYKFYRHITAYQSIFRQPTFMILRPSNPFFKDFIGDRMKHHTESTS